MSQIRLLIVDDHRLIRDAVQNYLKDDVAYHLIGEASNGEEAVAFISQQSVDVVLMDINMPKMNGFEASKAIKEQFPEVQIIALTMMGEPLHIKQMFDAGVSGYLLKTCTEAEIKRAIQVVMQGKHYYSNEVQRSVMNSLTQPSAADFPIPLTERELEVLKLIVQEYSNREIGDKLFISTRTVDAHRRNLMEKIGARNTAGLVKYAIQQGLV